MTGAGHSPDRSTPRATMRRAFGRALVSVGGLAALLLAWEASVSIWSIPLYVLPAPTVIALQIERDWALLVRHLQPTLLEAMGGFVIGNLIATGLAAGFVYAPPLSRMLYPVAIGLRTIPLVAITPLLVVWLGNGYAPKIAIAALISFFPTLVNMSRGFASSSKDQLELMHALAASQWQVFRLVRWPASLPYLFASLKIAATSSVLGAIVAEWIGSDRGLGYLIVAATFEYRVARLWATIAVSTALALAAFLMVVAVEHLAIPWRSEANE
ncbi:MAG: ABC transporter permease [Chloroflexi bacterium]|nr:ABC transporter permease [Chloroflexota bacterium]